MGILTLAEDRPTPKSVYNWRVYALAGIASCGSNMIGYTSAFIGTTITLASFMKEFGLDEMSSPQKALISENIVSLFIAGAFFGALGTYALGHFIGRKWSLAVAATVFFLGSGLQLGANSARGLGILYAGRVLSGLGTGIASNIIPIYLSELAPPAIRGRLVGLYELGWQIGGMLGFWINYGVEQHMPQDHEQWIIPFAIQLIPSGLLFIGALWIKESPRWLFLKNRRHEAMENLCWIRQLEADDMYITEEVAAIDQALEHQRTSIGIGFWKPFQALATNKSIGVDPNTVNLMTGIFGVIKAVMTFVWLLFLVDQFGRRNLLLVGAVTGSLCMWVIGAYICVVKPEDNPSTSLNGGGIAAIFFFYLWTAVYTPTWNGTPWVINSEFFDPNFRSLAQAATTASNWLFNFLISRFTEQMFDKMHYGVYFFFAALSFLAFFFAFFLIPETSGIPLEKVDRLFDCKPVWRANKMLKAALAEEEEQFRFEVKETSYHEENTASITPALYDEETQK
ncbi:Major facilitator superfamily domain general substrate transporter [Penicillium cf. griseofulvum]|uniref:Quinate transporter n=1 Tax=Penicillium cf. griseofulvum TaxID=2972120 RepID=A0A9W9M108_9EURO|nr:Major facilitator superfamily domain general substrate transporter [Penicillium cf. griseofulvum]